MEIQMIKDPNYDRYAGIKSLPGDPLNPNKPRPFRVDEDWNVIYLDEELDAVRRLGEERPIELAELGNSSWNGYDKMRAQGQRDGKTLRETGQATGDFAENYFDMREAWTKGADKYFHCNANCQASARGPAGETTARTISNAREIVDQRIKGDPRSASYADQRANVAGRAAGKKLRNSDNAHGWCRASCEAFRPRGLDDRY
jgi:hypothetical protein